MSERSLSDTNQALATEVSRTVSARPYFPRHELRSILTEIEYVLESGNLTQGAYVERFEKEFAEYCGTKHGVAVSNGTAALEIILRSQYLDGSEVVVPTNTFLASANAVIFAGCTPVFADIDPRTLCVGLEQLRAQITARTRGVIVVHIAGMICPEIEKIREYCRERDLFLIEDSAHAHGAGRGGSRAGSLSDAAAFSFFPTKPMTTAEGGMITTDDDAVNKFARAFRNHGVSPTSRLHIQLGHNYRMDELRAVLGISQLRNLDTFLDARAAIAGRYEERLVEIDGVQTLASVPDMRHSYYKFPVVFESVTQRNKTATALKSKYGIDTGTVYYPPCHLQPVVRDRPDLYASRGPYPGAEDVLPRVLCLPVHARMKMSDVDRVLDAVANELRLVRA